MSLIDDKENKVDDLKGNFTKVNKDTLLKKKKELQSVVSEKKAFSDTNLIKRSLVIFVSGILFGFLSVFFLNYLYFFRFRIGTKLLRDPMFKKDYFLNNVNYIKNTENDVYGKSGKGKISFSLKSGDNMFTALVNTGFNKNNVNEIINLFISNLNLKNLPEGQKFFIDYSYDILYKARAVKDDMKYAKKKKHKAVLDVDRDNSDFYFYPKIMDKIEDRYIEKMFFKLPNGVKYRISKQSNKQYNLYIEKPKLTTKRHIVSGVIKTNLFNDVSSLNIKPSSLYNVLNEYAFLIDFQRDLHTNDKFIFVLDVSKDEDGDILSENILYVNLILSGKNYEIFNFDNRFYDRKGRSIERSLLKTPIDGAKVTSKFNPKRKHPILGFTRAHLGIDLAAPTGTSIYAAGDGVVVKKTYNNKYGNYIDIRHNNEYTTRYAHMSGFVNDIKVGQRVRQRQKIGYVGMTGLATGPHLHYEIMRHGKHINPSTVKATVSKTLNKEQLLTFEKNVQVIDGLLKNISSKSK